MLTVLTQLTLASGFALTLMILIPVQLYRENVVSMPSIRSYVCAHRSRRCALREA
jgi:hypothetical protein